MSIKAKNYGNFDDCSRPEFTDQRLFGVAGQLGFNFMLSDQSLLGLDLQGNINLEDYLIAVRINFEIGRL